VRLTFPQAKAMVSNTRSCRNEGFWYFFFLELLGAPESVVFPPDLS